jgi:hypothetical protein
MNHEDELRQFLYVLLDDCCDTCFKLQWRMYNRTGVYRTEDCLCKGCPGHMAFDFEYYRLRVAMRLLDVGYAASQARLALPAHQED